jgi:small neutral amino acid transporter SnatA (MarC family)
VLTVALLGGEQMLGLSDIDLGAFRLAGALVIAAPRIFGLLILAIAIQAVLDVLKEEFPGLLR